MAQTVANDRFRIQTPLSASVLDFGDWEPRRSAFIIPERSSALEFDLTVLDGVGPRRAELLNQQGVLRWRDLWDDLTALPPRLRGTVMRSIERSYNALSMEDTEYFTRSVSRRQWWRIACTFPWRTVFLDIETVTSRGVVEIPAGSLAS